MSRVRFYLALASLFIALLAVAAALDMTTVERWALIIGVGVFVALIVPDFAP